MKSINIEDHKNIHIFRCSTLDFSVHVQNSVEIFAIHSGTADLYLENKKYAVKAGDVGIIFPNQIHFFENSENIDVTVMIFLPDITLPYRDLFCSSVPKNPILSGDNSDIIDFINFFYPKYYKKLPREISSSFLQLVNAMLLPNLELDKREKKSERTPIRLLYYCNEHYMEQITVNDVAKYLNVSVSQVAYIFSNTMHTTFTDYIQQKRIAYACDVFKSGVCNVTETAYASGFNSVRTFGRVFSEIMGMSPKQYVTSLKKY